MKSRPECARCKIAESAVLSIRGQFFCGHCAEDFVNDKRKKEQDEVSEWMKK